MNSKLVKLLQDKNVRVINEMVKVDELLTNIIQSKNNEQYIKRNIKEYEERNGFKYITLENCIKLLEKTNKTEAKNILNECKQTENGNNTMIIDLNNNIFKYKNKDVLMLNINGDIWIKGKDVAEILEYENTMKAISDHTKDNNKLSYDLLSKKFGNTKTLFLKSIDKQTIFINESGLYSLIFASKKPEAQAFREWVTDEVLPAIRKYGSYSIQSRQVAVSFYENNLISDYDNRNVIYIGDIGIHNNEHLYKFGKTANIYTRDCVQHRKTFEQFNVVHISECDNKDAIEVMFKRELQSKELLREVTINQKKQTELFTVTDVYDINNIMKMLTDLVNKYPLQAILDKEREHKEIILKNEYDKDVLIERERTKQEQERTKQKEIEIKLLIKQREIELQIKLAEIKLYEEQYKLKSLEMKMLDNKNTQSLTENIITPYNKFTNKYIQQTNNKNDYIVWTDLKQQYKQWYADNYDDNTLNTKDIKKLFEENIFKCAENKYHINDTYFRGWVNCKLINDNK